MKEFSLDSSNSTSWSLSQLSELEDDNDDNLFDEYVDRDVIDEELRSWIHHSSLHEDIDLCENEQPTRVEVESSDSSHLHGLDSNTDLDDGISGPYYFEFNDPTDMKWIIKLSVGMKFNNATQFRKVLWLYSI